LNFDGNFYIFGLKPLNTKHTMTCVIENPCPGFGQAQKCGWVKPVQMGSLFI